MELGLSFYSAKDEEVDNVSNLSCQPLRGATPRTCQEVGFRENDPVGKLTV